MTETRAPYHTTTKPRIIYPDSRLEILVESLDEIAELAPEAYPTPVNAIHTFLRETLLGNEEPTRLLAYLMSGAGASE